MPSSLHEIAKRVPELSLFVGLFITDFLLKWSFSSLPGRFVCNGRGAFGFEYPAIQTASILLILVLLWWMRERSVHLRVPLIFILAGGSGNLMDRLCFGCVRDLGIVGWFPAFNVADTYLTFGALLMVIAWLTKKEG